MLRALGMGLVVVACAAIDPAAARESSNAEACAVLDAAARDYNSPSISAKSFGDRASELPRLSDDTRLELTVEELEDLRRRRSADHPKLRCNWRRIARIVSPNGLGTLIYSYPLLSSSRELAVIDMTLGSCDTTQLVLRKIAGKWRQVAFVPVPSSCIE